MMSYEIIKKPIITENSMEQMADQIKTITLDQVIETANTLKLDTVYFLKGVER